MVQGLHEWPSNEARTLLFSNPKSFKLILYGDTYQSRYLVTFYYKSCRYFWLTDIPWYLIKKVTYQISGERYLNIWENDGNPFLFENETWDTSTVMVLVCIESNMNERYVATIGIQKGVISTIGTLAYFPLSYENSKLWIFCLFCRKWIDRL